LRKLAQSLAENLESQGARAKELSLPSEGFENLLDVFAMLREQKSLNDSEGYGENGTHLG